MAKAKKKMKAKVKKVKKLKPVKAAKKAKAVKPAKKQKPAPKEKISKKTADVKKGRKGKKFVPPTPRLRLKINRSPLIEIKSGTVATNLGAKDVPAALTASQIQKFREILTQKQNELSLIVHKKKEEEIEDITSGDEADVATRSVEKEMLFELTDNENQILEMVDSALRKIEKGIYGRCESCQKPIGKMRLEVMPWARYCIQCQALQEVTPTETPASF